MTASSNWAALTDPRVDANGITRHRHFPLWVAQAERANSVQPQHRGGWHQRYNHHVLCFHDETLKRLAEAWRTEELSCSMAEAIAAAAARPLDRYGPSRVAARAADPIQVYASRNVDACWVG
jgi:hypothetical protein